MLFVLQIIAYSKPTYANTAFRQLFLEIESDLKKGSEKLFKRHQPSIRTYSLYPYLESLYLENNLDNVSAQQLNSFLVKYPDLPIASPLRDKWLLNRASKKQWDPFFQIYQPSSNTELECHALFGISDMQDNDNQTNKDWSLKVKQLWLTGNQHPRACKQLFSSWEQAGNMTKTLVWQKIYLTIEEQNYKLARSLAKSLDKQERKLVELWIRTDKDPTLIKKSFYYRAKHPVALEILVYGFSKLAIDDYQLAVKLWQSLSKKHNFSSRHIALITKSLALSLANNKHPKAER